MSTKREFTITFVTRSQGARMFTAIDAISRITDHITITSKLLGRWPDRPMRKRRRAAPSSKLTEPSERLPIQPQLVYTANPRAAHYRSIDVEASLKKLGLSREQLVSRTWPRGSPQHRLKRAAAQTASVGGDPANGASRSSGASMGSRT